MSSNTSTASSTLFPSPPRCSKRDVAGDAFFSSLTKAFPMKDGHFVEDSLQYKVEDAVGWNAAALGLLGEGVARLRDYIVTVTHPYLQAQAEAVKKLQEAREMKKEKENRPIS
jgi:hypothetical protein